MNLLALFERTMLQMEMALLYRRMTGTLSTEECCAVISRMAEVQERLLVGARA